MSLSEIRIAALLARKNFERGNIDYVLLGSLYSEYSSVKNIRGFVAKSKKIFPRLNCGLASVYLKNSLGVGTVIKGKYKDHNHTFLLVKRKIIVDITADQYGGPSVYVGRIKKPWKINFRLSKHL